MLPESFSATITVGKWTKPDGRAGDGDHRSTEPSLRQLHLSFYAVDWLGWATFGFVATAILTAILVGAQELRLTRMDIPTMLGTLVTDRPARAKAAGTVIHLGVGQVFALFYASAFYLLHFAAWWLGLAFGVVHGALALALIIPALPAFHPRMASERTGPDLPMLEPPAFLAQNYGRNTILATLVAHAAYGLVLGAFLKP